MAVSIAIPLGMILALGHPQWILYASFVPLTAAFGRHSDYPARLHMQLTAGTALWLATVVGVLIGVVAPGSWAAVTVGALAGGATHVLSRRWDWQPHGAVFVVFAIGACSAQRHQWADLGIAALVALCAVAMTVLLGQAWRVFPPSRRRTKAPRRPNRSYREVFAREALGDLACFTLAPLLAGGISLALGGSHPSWAMLTAVIPLSGLTRLHRFSRVVHRCIGSLVGSGLAYAILATGPSPAITVLLIALLQLWVELVIARHYAWAVVAVTPLPLLGQYLIIPVNPQAVATDRILETLLGLAVTTFLLIAQAHWPRRRQLRIRNIAVPSDS